MSFVKKLLGWLRPATDPETEAEREHMRDERETLEPGSTAGDGSGSRTDREALQSSIRTLIASRSSIAR
jgi:hypothetical protein